MIAAIFTRARFAAAIAAILVISACGQNEQQAQTDAPAAQAQMSITRGEAGEPDTLDPGLATTTSEHAILGEVFLGLTTEDAKAQPIPGAAERWDVSADGLVWTFHLRDHTWSDGTPVTAEDFVSGWRRVLDPKTAAAYALILYDFKNAQAINAGKMPVEQLGVRAVDARTVEITLEHPAPYLPQLLRHQATFPFPRHVFAAHGADWIKPGIQIGNGPYIVTEWLPNDHITLVKNSRFYDAANVAIDRITFIPINDPNAALRRYRAGEMDALNYIPEDQIDWLKANLADQLTIVPKLTIAAVVLNETRKPFDDIRVREALNLAYDRDLMTKTIIRTGQEPAYSIVPPGIADYPMTAQLSFKNLTQPERIARAKELMLQAGYGPQKRLALTFSTIASQDARRVTAAIQQMWREVFVDLEIAQFDGRVLVSKRRAGDFDAAPTGWLADYNDAYNFLFLFLSDNDLNDAKYKNPMFDALLGEAQNEPDLAKRGQILARAEQMLLDDHVWIPTRYEVVSNLVQPHVRGWVTNSSDINRTRWLTIER